MSSENPERLVYTHVAELARAFGHEHRLKLLDLMSQGEWSLDELARRSDISVANASQHLHTLRRAGIVTARRLGKNVLFSLADGPVFDAVLAIRALAERNVAEVRLAVADYFERLEGMEPVSLEELRARLREGDFVLLDVRDEAEYQQGHLPGAIHIASDRLEASLSLLPADREIIAYCRGRYCILSSEAVALLRRHGFRSRRLQDGYAEWKAANRAASSSLGRPNEGTAL
jgi:rhodanese-related sulfurtransferase/DNA-binding transcriptional ArsR family regulator